MLINFAHEGLLTIECSCLEYDGHLITNLISSDSVKRAKGFMADRFIKPPVNVTMKFKCDVDVSKIVLNPRVGSQRSSGFELFKVLRTKGEHDVSIAQVIANDATNYVVFAKNIDACEGLIAQNVRISSERAFDCIRTVKLRIFKTAGSTLPALGSIEMWGRPSRHVRENVKKEVDRLWRQAVCPVLPKSCEQSGSGSEQSMERTQRLSSCGEVPDEFIDPISCEIMTIPMILPSGKIVDVSTLEKFREAEMKFGRGYSDPFTGVLFSDRSKPIVATALKSRLDKYLLENCDLPSIKTLPRTLGRKVAAPSRNLEVAGQSSGTQSPSNAQTVDQLLLHCLDGLPSYLESPQVCKKAKSGCINCCSSSVSPSSTNSYLFKLPCDHIVCRECLCSLKNKNNNICVQCHKPFNFHTVSRYYM